ncbi:hypothetical protein BKA00_001072 [Actinomadura coerulea]|uniref:Septum formation-related domain-containing protein n=1 Tax=Actinomadura coerulea TaxID=46159 RepID=A0A7X0KXB2_9ACTN|nr:hypothetical protein [Actinomadura coerulea]GGQ20569.1 hypothetical protein GCM10010187_41260 [Actinomadura coerulea]
MTTPPPSDDVPNDSEPSPAWAPPDAAASPIIPPAPAPDVVPPAPAGRRTNRFAVIALATGLLGLAPVAVGFVIAALVQTGRRGEKGKGLAIGGLVASVAWAAAVALTLALLPADVNESSVREDGKVAVIAMRPGECFNEFEEGPAGMFVRRSPCSTPHQGEVGAEGELPNIPYPGEKEVAAGALTVCQERTDFLLGSQYGPDLKLHVAPPDENAWKNGRRAAKCVMLYAGSGRLPTSLDQTLETRSKDTSELLPGDCIRKWEDYGIHPLVPCNRVHQYEVFAVYTMHGDEYPGEEAVEEKVSEGCTKRARKVWGANPPNDIDDTAYVAPTEQSWGYGRRFVICLVEGSPEPLKRSVVPH